MINWTDEQVEYFTQEYKKLNSPLIWDALFKGFGLRDKMLRRQIQPILKDMKIFGRALTVAGTTRYKTNKDDHLPVPGPLNGFWTRVSKKVQKNSIVICNCGYTEVAVLGDLYAMTWKNKGMTGLVADGPVRDSFGFIEEDIPLFCEYTIPICADMHWGISDVDVPIWLHGQLGEVLVEPGDFVYGDAEAVLIIPNELVEKVLDFAKKLDAAEEKVKVRLRNGETDAEALLAQLMEDSSSFINL